jgi:hypothetical protein
MAECAAALPDFRFGEHASLSLIGEGFNVFNETNIRGSSNTNYAGRNISISPYQAAQNGQPAQAVQANFYSPVSTPGDRSRHRVS